MYFMIFFCTGILPVNIENLLNYLPKTTNFGIFVVSATSMTMSIISILVDNEVISAKAYPSATFWIQTHCVVV